MYTMYNNVKSMTMLFYIIISILRRMFPSVVPEGHCNRCSTSPLISSTLYINLFSVNSCNFAVVVFIRHDEDR